MITARVRAGADVLLLAPVRGLSTEAAGVVAQLDEFRPSTVGLGASPDELRGISDYFVVTDAEPVVPLTSIEASEVRGLVRFGEVRVPNPSIVEALRWAASRGVPAEALDPTDDRAANLFAEHIGYVELVRRTVRERRVARNPPTPSTPDEYALAWDRETAPGRGSRDLAAARDRHLARRVRDLGASGARIALVVDRERFDRVRSMLDGARVPALDDD